MAVVVVVVNEQESSSHILQQLHCTMGLDVYQKKEKASLFRLRYVYCYYPRSSRWDDDPFCLYRFHTWILVLSWTITSCRKIFFCDNYFPKLVSPFCRFVTKYAGWYVHVTSIVCMKVLNARERGILDAVFCLVCCHLLGLGYKAEENIYVFPLRCIHLVGIIKNICCREAERHRDNVTSTYLCVLFFWRSTVML